VSRLAKGGGNDILYGQKPSETHGSAAMDLPPQEHMNELICGYWKSPCVYVAAKLGIADVLANGSHSIDDLADRTAMHPPSLFRLLRALASLGVFA
jgi:Dimerisation domain